MAPSFQVSLTSAGGSEVQCRAALIRDESYYVSSLYTINSEKVPMTREDPQALSHVGMAPREARLGVRLAKQMA